MTEAVEPDPESVWERRVALTEANGRRVNEAISRGHQGKQSTSFVCECGRIGCSVVLSVPLDEYERVRSSFDTFLVQPGHEIGEVEEVLSRTEAFVVVRKTGAGADVASETDPRS